MEEPKNIYKVVLNKDGSFCDDQTKVFFLKPGDILRASLSSRKFIEKMPILLTNVDLVKKSRSRYLNLVEIKHPCKLSRTEIQERYDCHFGTFDQEGTWNCDITMPHPGSYFLQIIFVSIEEFKKSAIISINDFGRSEWVVVKPQLSIGKTPISPRHLIMQTLLSRSMGLIDRWDDLIKMQTTLGYNCFHIAPFQKLGASGSLYAIADQLEVADYIVAKSSSTKKEERMNKVRDKIHELSDKYKCMFFGEVVLNHTSFDSEWLNDCPDACYNLQNTPQLTSAYVLDSAIQQFSRQIAKGEVKEYTKKSVDNEDDLNQIMHLLEEKVIKPLNLHEYFLIDVEKTKAQFIEYITKTHPELQIPHAYFEDDEDMFNIFKPEKLSTLVTCIEKHLTNIGAKKNGVQVDMKSTAKYYVDHPTKGSVEQLEIALKNLNEQLEKLARGYISEAITSLHNTMKYHKLEKKENAVTVEQPLVWSYFNHLPNGTAVANNGWIFSGDPTEDFAVSNNFYYLRRGIVIWGDLIKLRFGASKKDCPPLWKRMKHYVQKTAEIFGGLRLDNAHSTPIHVAEYLVRKGRKVNPNLYVFSELFTGSGEKDALFTKRIAVNALVREAIQQPTPHDLCASIHHFSRGIDVAVGSLDPYTEIDGRTKGEIYILKPRVPDGLFYDLTHDNVSYHEKRTFMDSLSTAALLSLSNCFIGTTKGFDEFYPTNLSVIEEKRLYPIIKDPLEGQLSDTESANVTFTFNGNPDVDSVELRGNWDEWSNGFHLKKSESGGFKGNMNLPPGTYLYKFIINGNWTVDHTKPIINEGGSENNMIRIESEVTRHSNMWYVRNELNKIHKKIADKYPEFYLDEITKDIISISRENVKKTKSCVLITRTAFQQDSDEVDVTINLPGRIQQFSLIAYAEPQINSWPDNKEFTYGIDANVIIDTQITRFADVLYDHQTQTNRLKFFRMPPGFVCVIQVILNLDQMLAVKELEDLRYADKNKLAKEFLAKITPADINYVFFSCETEERERTHNAHGTYVLPNYGALPYAGFGAFFKILKDARVYNNLGIPLFENLRAGYWILDFLLRRLEKHPRLRNLSLWVAKYFAYLKIIPKHLIPKYFSRIVMTLTSVLLQKVYSLQKLDENLEYTHYFKRLILACYEFVGDVPSGIMDNHKTTLCAGLPHFTTGWARCWGRDTFIAFKGGLLVPGLFEIARGTILMFATTFRHGLLPNLLDGGRNPRFNCRDATWWFIKAIKDYTEFTNDYSILKEDIRLKYLSDNKSEHENLHMTGEVKIVTLSTIIHEIFQRHATGIKFREWNAGHAIDEQMTYEGFNVELYLDESTGFVYGGNGSNCLTWMDKMGSSEKAGTKGVPGSSRDGAPIEMTALLKCGLEFVIAAHAKGHFTPTGVKLKHGSHLTFKEWAAKIKANFEKNYWIPYDVEQFKDYNLKPYAVRRKGIYKDTLGSSKESYDYYFRPNACVAMQVAPELFSRDKAVRYLQGVEAVLIKDHSLGVKTLDPKERIYIPWYDNANDSDNPLVAHGHSYHNGPEWVWIYGSFLMASLNIHLKDANMVVFMSYLTNHKFHIENTDWMSLPEMTNDNGSYCPFSCPAQAWSIATILEAIYSAQKLFKTKEQQKPAQTSS